MEIPLEPLLEKAWFSASASKDLQHGAWDSCLSFMLDKLSMVFQILRINSFLRSRKTIKNYIFLYKINHILLRSVDYSCRKNSFLSSAPKPEC